MTPKQIQIIKNLKVRPVQVYTGDGLNQTTRYESYITSEDIILASEQISKEMRG